jgi:hypothetical protein
MPISSPKSKQNWLPLFEHFISQLTIDSKESGVGPLVPYQAQRRFMAEVCEGLDRGIRHFLCLKARQLGISTIALAVDLFWLMVFEGTQGALITDDEPNRETFRVLLERYITSLPRGLRVGITRHNRNQLVLANGSQLQYLVAGKKRGNTTLGQSRALNFVHATEVGSYGSEEGFASLIASLAENAENRLYLFESTAHGFNLWKDLWDAADDSLTQKRFFIGWYDKEIYRFDKTSALFDKYWDGELLDWEEELVRDVLQRYGAIITPEQIAWHRWKRNEIGSEALMNQNFPWHEDMAFIMTGHAFFQQRRIMDDIKFIRDSEAPLRAYKYHMGENFLATELIPVGRTAECDLRVWEDPHPNGIYAMGVDPAFGRSDNKDRHAIELFRCYADKMVQVAEWATEDFESFNVAWVLMHLAGWYRNVMVNCEIGGPGLAVKEEIKHVKQLMEHGYLQKQAEEKGLLDIFGNVRLYMFHRSDSPGPGFVYWWQTNQDRKIQILNQLRDNYALRMLKLRSIPLLEEMIHIVQDGGEIAGAGRHKDDRTYASALATKPWIDWIRPTMIANDQTYDKTCEQERILADQPRATFVGNIVQDWFRDAERQRDFVAEMMAWRGMDW